MQKPTVHLNGTSKDELLGQFETASHAVRAAIEALTKAAPNGRDYYVQGSHAFTFAATEHTERLEKLKSVWDELQELWTHVYAAD